MKAAQAIAIAIVALSFLAAFYFYPILPERMVTHWGINGEPNGYSAKTIGLFAVPAMSLALLALFSFIPKIDPFSKNYKLFQKEYDNFVALILGFLFYVFAISIASNLGYKLNIMQFLAPGFAAIMYYTGVILSKAKQNWFIGIRTPWTLSSEKVWDKTHAAASNMFKAAGIIALLGIFFPAIGLIASVGILIAAAVFSFIYSYMQFMREKKGKRRK